jgi:DNA-binding NarL/FixJ family response regulator
MSTTPAALIVEDHEVMGRMMIRLLKERGNVEVWAVVKTAEAALEKLAAVESGAASEPETEDQGLLDRMPDLVLVDISLPGMSGIELVARLKELYPDLPCLVVSAHDDASYVKQALDNGARSYVPKGDPYGIVQAVWEVLGRE